MKKLIFISVLAAGVAAHAENKAAGSGKMTDPQIAAVVVAANNVDINAGRLAKSKASSKEVKDFAQTMITDHSAVNKSATDLVKKLKVKPEETEASKGLTSSGKKTMDKLKGMKGADFDKAYVDNEVSYHEAVLQTIDDQLIPNASNGELKSLLEKTRPAVAAHLDHAKELQAKLGTTK